MQDGRAVVAEGIGEDDQEVDDAEQGRAFLEEMQLLAPDGAPLTLDALSTTLFQVAAMQGMEQSEINAIRAVTYLLKDIKAGEKAEAPRSSLMR